MPVKLPLLSGESSTPENIPVKIFIPDNVFNANEDWDFATTIPEDENSNQNLENTKYSSSSDSHETDHNVPNRLESSKNMDQNFANLEDDIKYDIFLNNPVGELNFFHYECKVNISLSRGWPKLLKSLRCYQFCKMDHKLTYQRGEEKIYQKWLFYGNDFNSNMICRDLVLDNPHKYSHHILFYTEIDEKKYNETGSFIFIDKPSNTWPLFHTEHVDYRLTQIYKKHDFDLYVVAVREDGEEVPMKCWKWGYTFEWDLNNGDRSTPIEPEPIDLAQYPYPHHLRKLPNANDRQFLFQLPNLSGIPAKVIVYPKVRPEGHTEETFNSEIIKYWTCNPDRFL